jgi:hypothetical protein
MYNSDPLSPCGSGGDVEVEEDAGEPLPLTIKERSSVVGDGPIVKPRLPKLDSSPHAQHANIKSWATYVQQVEKYLTQAREVALQRAYHVNRIPHDSGQHHPIHEAAALSLHQFARGMDSSGEINKNREFVVPCTLLRS